MTPLDYAKSGPPPCEAAVDEIMELTPPEALAADSGDGAPTASSLDELSPTQSRVTPLAYAKSGPPPSEAAVDEIMELAPPEALAANTGDGAPTASPLDELSPTQSRATPPDYDGVFSGSLGAADVRNLSDAVSARQGQEISFFTHRIRKALGRKEVEEEGYCNLRQHYAQLPPGSVRLPGEEESVKEPHDVTRQINVAIDALPYDPGFKPEDSLRAVVRPNGKSRWIETEMLMDKKVVKTALRLRREAAAVSSEAKEMGRVPSDSNYSDDTPEDWSEGSYGDRINRDEEGPIASTGSQPNNQPSGRRPRQRFWPSRRTCRPPDEMVKREVTSTEDRKPPQLRVCSHCRHAQRRRSTSDPLATRNCRTCRATCGR